MDVKRLEEDPMVIASFIITPDGTRLQSYHLNDKKTHIDANGELYVISGGFWGARDYAKNNRNKKPARVFSITTSHAHEIQRLHFHWGCIDGDNIEWISLDKLPLEKINSLLNSNMLPYYFAELFRAEKTVRDIQILN